ncbi:MAG: WD40 repeat domain-containing protein [Planctomycetota bacterium]
MSEDAPEDASPLDAPPGRLPWRHRAPWVTMGLDLALITTIFLTRERWDAWIVESRFPPSAGPMSLMAVSPDARRAALCWYRPPDRDLVLWDVEKSRKVASYRAVRVRLAAFSPDGTRLLATVSAEDGGEETVLLDAETGDRIASLAEARYVPGIESGAFSLDSRFVAAAGYPLHGRTHVWSAADGSPIQTLGERDGCMRVAEFSPSGDRVLTVAMRSFVCLWDISTGERLWRIGDKGDSYTRARVCAGGRNVFISADGRALLVEAASGKPVADLGSCLSWVVDDTGSRIAVYIGSTDTVAILDAASGDALVEARLDRVGALRFIDGGRRILAYRSPANQGVVTILDARTGDVTGELPYHHRQFFALSPDGTRLLTHKPWTVEERWTPVHLYSVKTGRLLAEWPSSLSFDFLGDDRLLLPCSDGVSGTRILRRIRPEEWWGVFVLWHLWLIVALAGPLAWSGWRDIKRMRGTATGIQQGCTG